VSDLEDQQAALPHPDQEPPPPVMPTGFS
jgi:hypothetical protein